MREFFQVIDVTAGLMTARPDHIDYVDAEKYEE